MSDFLITENQLLVINNYINKNFDYQLANQNWNKFTADEKESIVECLKFLHPEKAKLIKESSWYNTLGDIVGIFDPTGVVDLVNGISYIRQGDNLFGFLSIISAVPYLGDVVAKPVLGALKVGAPSAKALEGVLKLSKAGKSVEAAKQLTKLSDMGGITGAFVRGFSKVANKVRGYIERAPFGPFKGLRNTILQWFNLFEDAAKVGKASRTAAGKLASKMAKMSPAKQVQNMTDLIKATESLKGPFRSYRTSSGFFSWKTLFRGMPQIMGRNASVRALARQTKWWTGFLDWMNLGNWVGPEELSKKMGESEFMSKMEEYQKTPEAQKYFQEDFGTETPNIQQEPSNQNFQQSTQSVKKPEENSVSNFFRNIFIGQMNPLPG